MTIDEFAEKHGLLPNPTSRLTLQSDAEITAQLNAYAPVISERNLWAFWDKGFNAMPPWRKRNVINWVRRDGLSWTVRVLDTMPGSPNHIKRYIDAAYLPAAVQHGTMRGHHASQHTSDLVKLALLYQHGGVYMDVGIMLIRDLDDICWSELMDPHTPYEVSGPAFPNPKNIPTFFLASRKEDPFIYRWLQVFLHIWQGHEEATGIHTDPLFKHIGLLKPTVFPADTDWPRLNDYLAIGLAFLRVRRNKEPGPEAFDGPSYFHQKFFLISAVTEMLRAVPLEDKGLTGLLALPCKPHASPSICEDSKAEAAEQERARNFVHDVLAESSMCKFSQGFADLGVPCNSALLWNDPAHANDDCLPGSWGELLRHGSVYYRQGRSVKPLIIEGKEDSITELEMLEPAQS